jgi:hypothetical protein
MSHKESCMSTLEEEQEKARILSRQINHEARSNPHSPYAGKFVGILHGQVVVVADTLDEVAEILERLEEDPYRRYFVDASADYDSKHDVWLSRACQE